MPEINELIIADSELKSIKLEYEQLLIQQKHLAEKITKAKNENSKIYFILLLYYYIPVC